MPSKPPKIKLGSEDLEKEFRKQIRFLVSSSKAYDNGDYDEAIRLATTLRVLLHDTSTSKSLLGQLARKNILFLDTAAPFSTKNLLTSFCLTFMRLGPNGASYQPFLDDGPYSKHADFNTWWNSVVICGEDRQRLTRSDIVLIAANQDGGAHVDPEIDLSYARITKSNSTGWHFINGDKKSQRIPHAMQAALRQVSHEVLRSLNAPPSEYIIKSTIPASVFSATGVSIAVNQRGAPIHKTAKVGRNRPCPCGSGKKYKKCCGTP